MKIESIEAETAVGICTIPADVDVVLTGDVPSRFRGLAERLWQELLRHEPGAVVKIKSIAVETGAGRRTVQLTAPIDVDPTSEMPSPFRSLTDLLWKVLCEVAANPPKVPKVEA